MHPCFRGLVKTVATFVRILQQVKALKCDSGYHWSAIEFSYTFYTFILVFSWLWRHGENFYFLNGNIGSKFRFLARMKKIKRCYKPAHWCWRSPCERLWTTCPTGHCIYRLPLTTHDHFVRKLFWTNIKQKKGSQ